MMLNNIRDAFESFGNLPNKFSIGIGSIIRECREEDGMSQTELAKRVYKRRASISDIENGKMYPDIETLTRLSAEFKKPLLYFIPEYYRRHLEASELSVEDHEILMVFQRLPDSKKKVALAQLKALADWDTDV